MEDHVSIASEAGRLTLSDFTPPTRESSGWYSFTARLEFHGLTAEVRVHDFIVDGLPMLFEELARDYKGWEGEKQWEAMERQLGFVCTSDRLGHAYLAVRLRPDLYDSWAVDAHLKLDAAQHEPIARHLRRLLARRAA